jgi:hypothetical protein
VHPCWFPSLILYVHGHYERVCEGVHTPKPPPPHMHSMGLDPGAWAFCHFFARCR